ncbi:MAG: hypothetical protein ACRDNY_02320 [Gaiellaceae bacterium]
MATTTKRRIGTFGTVSRVLVGVGLLYLALFDWDSWGLAWYDVALGLVALPGVMVGVGLAARRLGAGPLRFTGPIGLAVNTAIIVALASNQYTGGGAALFYGTTLLVAAWRAQPGCEGTVLSNWILRRDDQVGCPTFTPIDELEARLTARNRQRRARTEASTARTEASTA